MKKSFCQKFRIFYIPCEEKNAKINFCEKVCELNTTTHFLKKFLFAGNLSSKFAKDSFAQLNMMIDERELQIIAEFSIH